MPQRLSLIFAGIVLGFVISVSGSLAQITPVSGGAVGFKVLPNPEHLSPLEWYNRYIPVVNQGAPQELEIDGFQAVEDGRSVYVNAANYAGNRLYTNIYVFSYDANDPDGFTKVIFDKITDNLRFSIVPGTFAIPGQGICNNAERTPCESDFDCPTGNTCRGDLTGDMIRRDTRRVSDIVTFNDKLRGFRSAFGNLPQLLAGSFIEGVSYSTWPSWRATLSSALGEPLPTDPINEFLCPPNTDPITCWDAVSRTFACPLDGYAYGYQYVSPSGPGLPESAIFGANFETLQARQSSLFGGWVPGIGGSTIGGCSMTGFHLTTQNDTDSDGVPNALDNCNASTNPNQQDSDADGTGDQCDVCPFDPHNDGDCTLSTVSCDAPLTDASIWLEASNHCVDGITGVTYNAGGTVNNIPALGQYGAELDLPQCDWGSGISLTNAIPFTGDFEVSIQIEDLDFDDFIGPLPTRYTAAAILNVYATASDGKVHSGSVHIIKDGLNRLRINLTHIFDVYCWGDPTRSGCGGTSVADRINFYRTNPTSFYTFTPGDTLRIRRSGTRLDYIFESAANGTTLFTYPQPGDAPGPDTPVTVKISNAHGGEAPGIPAVPRYGPATRMQFIWNAICNNVAPAYPCYDGNQDGICADVDNCPYISNASQLDSDGDGIGDACEDSCGDGVVDTNNGEQCDPLAPSHTPPLCTFNLPNTFGQVTCYGPDAGPSRQCTWNFSQCSLGTCGNGFVEPNEECEDGDLEVVACTTASNYNGLQRRDCTPSSQVGGCTWQPYNLIDVLNPGLGSCAPIGRCGDGILQPEAEQCDDGAANGPSNSCNANCLINTVCIPGTYVPGCGNTFLDAGEACDDGNTTDGDGCSSTCAIETAPAPQTQLPPITNWNIVQKWNWGTINPPTTPASTVVGVTPLVANVDSDPQPEVIFMSFNNISVQRVEGHLRIVDGITGQDNGTVISNYNYTGIAVGDINNDGVAEIVLPIKMPEDGTYLNSHYVQTQLRAYHADGTELYRMSGVIASGFGSGQSYPSIADLDQDGNPEVIFGSRAFNGEDLTDDPANIQSSGRYSRPTHIADVNGGGLLDVVNEVGVSASLPSMSCIFTSNNKRVIGSADFIPGGNPEIVIFDSISANLVLYDNCTLITSVGLSSTAGHYGRGAIGNFVSNDPGPEIVLSGRNEIVLYDFTTSGNLVLLDSMSVNFGSHAVSGFDFEYDGVDEILYLDNDGFHIYTVDAPSSAINELHYEPIPSSTGYDRASPVVADLDNDGEAEIIIASDDGITVFGPPSGVQWSSARSVWNQEDYHVTNINDNMSVPAVESQHWSTQTINSQRVNVASSSSGPAPPPPAPAPPAPTAICQTSCGDGTYDPGEECGEGGSLTDTCSGAGYAGGNAPVTCMMASEGYGVDSCVWDTSACIPAICGDGVITPPEVCDPVLQATETCANLSEPFGGAALATCVSGSSGCSWNVSNCVFTPNICGNGVTEAVISEECDDANLNDTDGCTNSCMLDTDMDGVLDSAGDNCLLIANASQTDSDPLGVDDDPNLPGQQRYGNACDADYNDDGYVNFVDWGLFTNANGSVIGDALYDPDMDCNDTNSIDLQDFSCLIAQWGGVPGP